MQIRTGERGRGPTLRRGDLITVDYYKKDDDDDFLNWFDENTDDGIGVKVVDYDDESDLIWIENCPYAIESWLCVKD